MPSLDGASVRRLLLRAAARFAALLVLFYAQSVEGAGAPPSDSPAPSDTEIILSVDLDGEPILDALVAIERGGRIFLPVCPLTEPLSLAIRCGPHGAHGFLLQESRPFVLDLEEGYLIAVRNVSRTEGVAFRANGEIYAELQLLSRALPLDLDLDKDASLLHVHAREPLPRQEFKKRQQTARREPPPQPKPHLPEIPPHRALLSTPTVDLVSQQQLDGDGSTTRWLFRNALQISGDLLYLTGVAHLAFDNDRAQRLDVTLAKRRDHPFLIGPLPVTQVAVGAAQTQPVDGIGGSTATMYGVGISNRPLYGASQFLYHDIDGYLPEGWDAELLHNGVPVAYQPPTGDGMYHFRNLRLHYGVNDFKVILHGPFGETRLSEQTFVTDSTTPKGGFLYSLSTAWQTGLTERAEPGVSSESSNVTFTSDFGLTEEVTGSALLVRRAASDKEEDYLGVGIRSAVGFTLLSLELLQRLSPRDQDNGQLLTLKTSGRYLADLSVESAVRFFHDFSSPQFERQPDPLMAQATLKGSSSITGWYGVRFPVSAMLSVETRRSGGTDCGSTWRVSGGWNGWNGGAEADLSYRAREFSAGGVLQISTRVRKTSIRGQAGFRAAPSLSPSVVNLTADQELGYGYYLNSAFSHDTVGGVSALKVGLSKKLGILGYSLSAAGDTNGAYSVNVAVSTSLAADRVNTQMVLSSEPLSSYGMVAASATLRPAPGAPGRALPSVGFLVNGGPAITVTGSSGAPVIAYLQPDIPVDITVDLATLQDPFMVPLEEGCHLIPRAGVVSECRFTMVTGGEIDGMVFITLPEGELPLKGVRVDLMKKGRSGMEMVYSTVSEESGYYLFKAVRPGKYLIAISDAELARLKAAAVPPRPVTMPEGGDQVTGNDLLLAARPTPK